MAPKDLDIETRPHPEGQAADGAPTRAAEPGAAAPAPEGPPPRRRKRALPALLGLALLSAAGYFGWEWWTVGRFTVRTDNAYVHADFAVLAPKVSGYVERIPVKENDRVAKGAPLVVLDDGDYRVRLRIAEAAVASKKAALTRLESPLAEAQAAIDGASANVEAAQALLTQAAQNLDRYENLAKSDYATRQRVEETRATHAAANAAVVARRSDVSEAEAALSVLTASRGEMEAALAGAEAERDAATRDLDAATILAPFDGVVGNLGAAEGDYVMPGSRLLALVPLDGVYIDANFKETQLEGVHPGAPVTVEIDAYPERSFTGHVVSFAPATGAMFSLLPPENATGNFTKVVQRLPVRIAVPEEIAAEGWLRPGLSVTVSADSRDGGADAR